MTEVEIDIFTIPDEQGNIISIDNTRKFFTKIINGRMIHVHAEGEVGVSEKGFFVVLTPTIIQFISENCRIPAHWRQEKDNRIYHLYKGAFLGALEIWIDPKDEGYVAKYFDSQQDIRNHYKTLIRSERINNLLS